jgi:predicted dehydrogenase
MKRTTIGMIGCGNIAPQYMKGSRGFDFLDLAYCADLVQDRAEALAQTYGLTALPVDKLLHGPSIEVILNLTVPLAHEEVTLASLNAGKNVYSEKPLAVDWAGGEKILKTAADLGLQVGCAPDTFLGGSLQTARQLIDNGDIGTPIAATAFMANHGPESWHPNPFFYYQRGGGPLLDMGPYYLTALVHLLGPVKQVMGSTRTSFPTRIATSKAQYGKEIKVEVPTHVTALLDFVNGAAVTFLISFDIWFANLPQIEIYGTEGSLSIPDPNGFGGPVRLRREGALAWTDVPLTYPTAIDRGVGLADMVAALGAERTPRASGLLAGHILEVLEAIHTSSVAGKTIELTTQPDRPEGLPVGWTPENARF